MTTPTPIAGGFFLVLPLMLGFGWGLATHRAMEGAIYGAAVGIVLALIIWLIDRLRRG